MDRIQDADVLWLRDLEHVFMYGNRVSPRGMLVYESLAYQSIVPMINPIIFNPMRKLGYKFMAAEAAWILSGDDKVASIAPYSKNVSEFSDDGDVFFGAYGPKIRNQLNYVIDMLHKDIDSRQAVINIWRENPRPSKDIPCTLSLQFLVRHHAIHCVATMRSSDLWLGHPYDIFSFSAVSFYIMLRLNEMRSKNRDLPIVLGNLHLTAGSKHIYDRNIADVKMILENFQSKGPVFHQRSDVFVSSRYHDSLEFIEHLWECADSKGGAFSLMFGDK